MSTRGCIGVYNTKGELKIAQIISSDSYPESTGDDLLEYISSIDLNTLDIRLNNVEFLTDDEYQDIEDKIKKKKLSWNDFPHLMCGWEIVNYVYNEGYFVKRTINKWGDGKLKKLHNSEKFFKDSLWCEWAYIVDLQKQTFEVYRGFNRYPLTPKDRFYYLQDIDAKANEGVNGEEHKPVKLVLTLPLNQLPPTLTEFV